MYSDGIIWSKYAAFSQKNERTSILDTTLLWFLIIDICILSHEKLCLTPTGA